MSRSALSVTADILGLKILIGDTVKSLEGGADLATHRRQSLAKSFHRYIRHTNLDRLRPNAISKLRGGLQNIPATVVRSEAAEDAPNLLAVIDKFANGHLEEDEKSTLVEFLTRVNAALDRSRATIPISRYL